MKIYSLRRLLLPFVALCASLLQPGCSTITERPLVAQVAVQYATLKVVQDHPERAARVIEIATFIRESAGNSTAASVALLEVAVRERINWASLDPADTLLVDLLIAAVREELIARLGTGPLSPENALILAQVASWIADAATSVRQPASPAVGPPTARDGARSVPSAAAATSVAPPSAAHRPTVHPSERPTVFLPPTMGQGLG